MFLKPTHVFYLTFMNYSIQNLILLPHVLNTAARDIWISTLLSTVIALVASALLWIVEKSHPGMTLFDIFQLRFSKSLQFPIFFALGLYLVLLCVITTAYLGQFVTIGFIQETPLWVVLFLFSLAIGYTLNKGIVALANLAGLLTFATIISGSSMSFAVTGHRDISVFLPILEHGFLPVLHGSALFMPMWVEMLFLGFLPRRGAGEKKWLKTYLWITFANLILCLGHTIGPISVFGIEQSQNLNFPALSAVKVISLGFIDRFDIYGLMLMIFGSLIRVAMYAYLALAMFQAGLGRKPSLTSSYGGWIPVFTAVLLVIGSFAVFRNTTFFDLVIGQLLYVATGLFVLLLLLYAALFLIERRGLASHL